MCDEVIGPRSIISERFEATVLVKENGGFGESRRRAPGNTGGPVAGFAPFLRYAFASAERSSASLTRLSGFFRSLWILSGTVPVESPMTKKDKIAFIKSSKRKTHVYHDLNRYSDQQLNDLIREIVQGLVRESEIIANAYINGYR